ncbi:hypothetical protein C9J01_08660 [Photobacterium rosenbergii]|uniref:Uncharacterized protein n=1 Tax=Photobacterium rosenbergii TaxID=294936 RepID=A0A2T3NHN8_9GAMM|nr:hypothetical protein [Photobacterium rosenbergii]PSW14493.1 hypothetical protein C9J01_08660 [Photobacterium rosenbergii]
MSKDYYKACISSLTEEELSAIISLYALEYHQGEAAYVVDENIGVWLSDLNFEELPCYKNTLGIYTIEESVLKALISKGLLTARETGTSDKGSCGQLFSSYQIIPKAKSKIRSWLALHEVKLPILVDYNY